MNTTKGNILITGCSGRIGSRTAIRFGQAGYQIIGLDVQAPQGPAAQWIDFFPVDLGSDESVEKALAAVRAKHGSDIVSVIHLAAYYSFAGEKPELYDKITVQGSARMLRGVKKFNRVEQFLFSSTQLIHDTCAVGAKINEDSPIVATWGYPLSKVKTEKLLREEHGSIPLVMMRIAGCYDEECHSIPISNQIQRIYEKQLACFLFPGDLTHGAPFLHLDDMIDAIWLAVAKRHEIPSELILIIGEGTTIGYNTLQRAIWKLLTGKERPTLRIPKWFAKMGAWMQNHTPGFQTFIKPWMIDVADAHYELDIEKARRELGWQPKHQLLDTLPAMVESLKRDPIAWYKINGLALPRSLKKRAQKESQ